MPRHIVSLLALASALAVPLACASQVVDAVDREVGSGGAAGSGTGGGSGGVTGGSAGSDVIGGAGPTCPGGGSEGDLDGDTVIDCLDQCPEDPLKAAERGPCGCGLADTSTKGAPTCADLVAVLAHRYAFNGTGTVAVDSVLGGNADGEVMNAELSGDGTLVLAGEASDQYVELPNRLISAVPPGNPGTGSVTLEAWLRWNGGGPWQRIFDFGDNNGPSEGQQGPGGSSFLFLTPRTYNAPSVAPPQTSKLRVAYKRPGVQEGETILDGPLTLPSGTDDVTHVAVVIDGTLKRMSLYVGGVLQQGTAYFRNVGSPSYTAMQGVYDWSAPVTTTSGAVELPPAIDLSVVNDINNWLGRSQFQDDDELGATLYEFRIYSTALSPELVAISFRAGPDAVFLQ
jgi:hypothetical protein